MGFGETEGKHSCFVFSVDAMGMRKINFSIFRVNLFFSLDLKKFFFLFLSLSCSWKELRLLAQTVVQVKGNGEKMESKDGDKRLCKECDEKIRKECTECSQNLHI